MKTTNNVVNLNSFKRSSQQELIDDIGARAFLLIRNEAEALGIPVRDVITEHMLGMALVIESVEGTESAQHVLNSIDDKLTKPEI